MTTSTAIRVDLFGAFRLVADGMAASRAPNPRQQQIVALLVLNGYRAAVPRQRIAGRLWPESTDAQALTNLRRELHHLRDECPLLDALIETGTRTLSWRGETVQVDVLAFDAAADRGLAGDRNALQDAARLYKGDLLPDCTADWIDADRERLRQRARLVLARLVGLLEQERALTEAIEHAHRLLTLDPLDESAWRALMRSHAQRGARGTALHVYQQCAAVLKRELGIQPSTDTRAVYRAVLDVHDPAPACTQSPHTAVYPLIGRDAEWSTLRHAWHAAAAGRPRLVLIRGESGIGKTRLADEQVHWSRVNNINTATTRCFAGEGRLAYAPIAAWLDSEGVKAAIRSLDAARLTDIARLRPDIAASQAGEAGTMPQLESWQRLRFFESLAHAFRSTAPAVLVVDDLQWADADTIEWLQYFLRSAGDTRCLVVGAVRVEEEHDNPPLVQCLAHLERHDLLTVVPLGRLGAQATGQLADAVAGTSLDEGARERVFHDTEGHPLFIIERGRMALASIAAPPSRVQSVVAARLALLSADARAIAEVAAAVGRDFRFDILARACDLDEGALVRALDELWQRHIVREQKDERWDFSHDRIREEAYAGIAPARRRLIHRRIAQGLQVLFARNTDDASALIAVHLERGGQTGDAIPFLERAATVAMRMSANQEAIRCVTHAIELLSLQPAGAERDERELAMRSTLSIALNAGRGYTAEEVEDNLNRILALSRAAAGEVPVRWLWAAFSMRFVRSDLKGTREMAEATLARSLSDPSCRCEAHHAMGATLSSLGELDGSRQHFELALAAYDEGVPKRSALGSDLGVFAHAWYAHTLWLLGDEPNAVAQSDEGIALAQRLDHVYSHTLALAYAALLHQLRRDRDRVIECTDTVTALCTRYEIAYYGDWAQVLGGWARGQTDPAEGIALIESALRHLDRQRALARRPYYLSLLAELYDRGGDRARAAAITDAAIGIALEHSDVWWLPALYHQRSTWQAEPMRSRTLWHALEVAQAQNSRALERRLLSSSPRTI